MPATLQCKPSIYLFTYRYCTRLHRKNDIVFRSRLDHTRLHCSALYSNVSPRVSRGISLHRSSIDGSLCIRPSQSPSGSSAHQAAPANRAEMPCACSLAGTLRCASRTPRRSSSVLPLPHLRLQRCHNGVGTQAQPGGDPTRPLTGPDQLSN